MSYSHHFRVGGGMAPRVSRVLFQMVISLGPIIWGAGYLVTSVAALTLDRTAFQPFGEPPAGGPVGDCCGEDCPFHSVYLLGPWALQDNGTGLCCSHRRLIRHQTPVPMWTVRARDQALPPLNAGHPALCSSDFPLPSREDSDHPAAPCLAQPCCRAQ